MTILAIDTSMAACSAAILRPDQARPVQRFERMPRGHAEAIFPMIVSVMEEAGCGFDALTKIAVTLGPGSFTGIRAGVAAARGLALAAALPVVGASSLEVMAQGCVRELRAEELSSGFAVLHDARRDEFYFQCFNARAEALGETQALSSVHALSALPLEITLIVGSGAPTLAAEAERRGRALRALLPDLLPEAADLAVLAGNIEPQDQPPAPFYLRPPDAKPQTSKILARAE